MCCNKGGDNKILTSNFSFPQPVSPVINDRSFIVDFTVTI